MKKYTPRLKEKYINEVIPKLKEDLGYANVMQVPKLNKICINQGVGDAVADKKLVDSSVQEMSHQMVLMDPNSYEESLLYPYVNPFSQECMANFLHNGYQT